MFWDFINFPLNQICNWIMNALSDCCIVLQFNLLDKHQTNLLFRRIVLKLLQKLSQIHVHLYLLNLLLNFITVPNKGSLRSLYTCISVHLYPCIYLQLFFYFRRIVLLCPLKLSLILWSWTGYLVPASPQGPRV